MVFTLAHSRNNKRDSVFDSEVLAGEVGFTNSQNKVVKVKEKKMTGKQVVEVEAGREIVW